MWRPDVKVIFITPTIFSASFNGILGTGPRHSNGDPCEKASGAVTFLVR
jgi:hypothetical protein